jgi:hypothetical protein
MAALILPEYYADLATTTLNGAYTAGSGSMVVTSAAALSTTRQFHFYIADQSTGTVKCIGKATALVSNTFTVTMTIDTNANSGDNVVISLCAAAMDQIRADVVSFGTFANLPTVAKAGDRYKQTDGPYDWIYSGSSWQAFYNGYLATLPLSSGWTSENLGGSGVLSFTNGNGYLIGSSSAGTNFVSAAYRAAPGSTPYSFVARFAFDSTGFIRTINGGSNPAQTTVGGFFIGFRDSGGKYVTMNLLLVPATSPFLFFNINEMNSATSLNTNPNPPGSLSSAGLAQFYGPGAMWMKIQNDGTNLNFFFSIDGQNWYKVYTQTITSFMANANNVCWGSVGNSGSATVALYDWTQGT